MKAVIMAGGKGTRLKPYSTTIPKPLVPVGEKAIIEILLNRLKNSGVDEVFICLNHFAEFIMAFLGDGRKFDIRINYSVEDRPLSTVAPVKLIHDLPEDFLVMNGDLLTDLNFGDLFLHHKGNDSMLTVATYKRTSKIDFGVIDVDCNHKVAVGFREKPEFDFDVSMGVYAMNRKVLDFVPLNEPFGFDHLMLRMLEDKHPISVYQYEGYWLDIGRPEDYERANEDIYKISGLL
ncbi:MAG: sugar phosphate nucleotidyltransferase [Bacteroidetes bacterium]|nr:sugar phosphate nucleotidyltransferase [Bacteroidota bacterium]